MTSCSSWSAGANNALDFLEDVVQVDASRYDATLLSNTVEQRSDLGGVVEQILRYSLTSSESKFDVLFSSETISYLVTKLFWWKVHPFSLRLSPSAPWIRRKDYLNV